MTSGLHTENRTGTGRGGNGRMSHRVAEALSCCLMHPQPVEIISQMKVNKLACSLTPKV